MASDTPTAEAQEFMKQSFRHRDMDALLAADPELAALYKEVQAGVVRNVKTKPGGFKATSGVTLAYYLNLSTNFMDPQIAPKIVALMSRMLIHLHESIASSPEEKLAVVGMEVAGGMLVSQLVASMNPALLSKFDFVYMRKNKKSTGTAQQLEGLKMFTERTASSAPRQAIWIDDVNSTGSSLTEGADTLETDYNMQVVAALYLVDRSADRAHLPVEKMYFARPRFVERKTRVYAIMDLSEIDPLVPRE
jgi:orotate phosphoribosyltransferase